MHERELCSRTRGEKEGFGFRPIGQDLEEAEDARVLSCLAVVAGLEALITPVVEDCDKHVEQVLASQASLSSNIDRLTRGVCPHAMPHSPALLWPSLTAPRFCLSRSSRGLESRQLESRPNAAARLGLEASAGWARCGRTDRHKLLHHPLYVPVVGRLLENTPEPLGSVHTSKLQSIRQRVAAVGVSVTGVQARIAKLHAMKAQLPAEKHTVDVFAGDE
jgi:hypothetical protein